VHLGALSLSCEMRQVAMSSSTRCAWAPCPLSHLAPWSPVLQSQDATGSRVLGRILRQYALSSVAFCARVPFPSIARCARYPCPLPARCDWQPRPLSHPAPVCPVPQPRDATGCPVLCRIVHLGALSFNHEMRQVAMSSSTRCAWAPCPLSHLAPWSPVLQSQDASGSRVLGRILHQYALSSVAFCARVPFPSIARCAR